MIKLMLLCAAAVFAGANLTLVCKARLAALPARVRARKR
jgi:hypothetical protein